MRPRYFIKATHKGRSATLEIKTTTRLFDAVHLAIYILQKTTADKIELQEQKHGEKRKTIKTYTNPDMPGMRSDNDTQKDGKIQNKSGDR